MAGDPERRDGPPPNVVGERVALGPLRRDLLATYARWVNDLDTLRLFGAHRPTTLDAETRWYEEASASEESVHFTVYALPELRPVGTTSLEAIDHRNRTAVFGLLVGDPEDRGKGYGTEATRLVLRYAFGTLGLVNVMLTVFEYNGAGLRAYEKAGFRPFGRRRRSQMSNGRLWDVIFMECLSDEFERPASRRAVSDRRAGGEREDEGSGGP
jgi:RimJ/RimL family protein N-acetyltransferase